MNPQGTQGQGDTDEKGRKEGSESKHTHPFSLVQHTGEPAAPGPRRPSPQQDMGAHTPRAHAASSTEGSGADRRLRTGHSGAPSLGGPAGHRLAFHQGLPGEAGLRDSWFLPALGAREQITASGREERKRHTAGESKVLGLRPLYLKLLRNRSRPRTPFPQHPSPLDGTPGTTETRKGQGGKMQSESLGAHMRGQAAFSALSERLGAPMQKSGCLGQTLARPLTS